MQPAWINKPPSNVGPAPGLCMLKILAVHNSDPIGGYPSDANVAAAFTYSADVQTPSGPPVAFRPATRTVRPENAIRWPSPWIVQAFRVGAILPGAVMDGKVYLTVAEERWAAPCDWQPASTPPTPPTMPTDPPIKPPGPVQLDPTPPYPGANP